MFKLWFYYKYIHSFFLDFLTFFVFDGEDMFFLEGDDFILAKIPLSNLGSVISRFCVKGV